MDVVNALRKPLVLALLLMIVFSFCLVTTLPVRAQVGVIYYVNVTTGDDTYSSEQAKNPDTPWRTIQHAINEVPAGSIINVAAGLYEESIIINKPLTLKGAQAGVDPTQVPRDPNDFEHESIIDATRNWAVKMNSVAGVVLDGFTLKGVDVKIMDASGIWLYQVDDSYIGVCKISFSR